MSDDQEETRAELDEAVNMTPHELEEWLVRDESKDVGQKKGGAESTGHAVGRTIVDLLDKHKADLTDSDHDAMGKVVSYVHRHPAQRPDGDVSETRWRYSPMNWGHDPLR